MSNEVTVHQAPPTAINMLPVQAIKDALDHIENIRKNILRDGVDFGTVPGTDKPCLLKPGMEKMAAVFNLAPIYRVTDSQVEPDKEWAYEVIDRKTGTIDKRQSIGFYRYQSTCDLVHKGTGDIWCSAQGVCSSRERGRETAPENTIIKMSQKRALAAAILNATFSSHLFTVDIEDDPDFAERNAKNQPPPGGIERTMTSKYDNGKCGFCGKSHIPKNSEIVLSEGKWGARDCWQKLQDQKAEVAQLVNDTPPANDAPPPDDNDLPFDAPPATNGQPDHTDLMEEADALCKRLGVKPPMPIEDMLEGTLKGFIVKMKKDLATKK